VPHVKVLFGALVGASLLATAVSAQVAPTPAPTSSRTGQKIAVDGLAEFLRGDVLVVSGYRLRATPTTRFTGNKDVTALSAVPLGCQVDAKGTVQADGTIVVEALEARPRQRSDAGRGVVSGALDQEGKWLAGGGSIFRAALAKDAPEARLPKADPQYERVKGILMRMAPASLEESLRLHIVNSKDWNARGLPNGSIAVAAGLLADMDDDEVALVLGHELAHITHQHAQKTLADAERRKFVTQLIADLVPEGGALTHVALTVGGAVALKTWQSGYSRSLETEADRVGMGYVAAGGFDVRKAPRVWERFREKYGDEQSVKNFVVGKHPRNAERAGNARAELRAYYPTYEPSGPPAQLAAAPSPAEPAMPAARASSSLVADGNQLASGQTPVLAAAPAPSTQIEKGMTLEQVRALLGAPKEEFRFANGQQTKWIFAHLKVTFLDGRVTAVEF
jgi:Zn-dependent protease with chaperone function